MNSRKIRQKDGRSSFLPREQIDIAWTGYTYNMQKEIENDSYLSLNDYISEKDTPNFGRNGKRIMLLITIPAVWAVSFMQSRTTA